MHQQNRKVENSNRIRVRRGLKTADAPKRPIVRGSSETLVDRGQKIPSMIIGANAIVEQKSASGDGLKLTDVPSEFNSTYPLLVHTLIKAGKLTVISPPGVTPYIDPDQLEILHQRLWAARKLLLQRKMEIPAAILQSQTNRI